jgi:hypothetical protein
MIEEKTEKGTTGAGSPDSPVLKSKHPKGGHLRTGQRSTRAEREAVTEALQSIWQKASETDGEIEFRFPETVSGQRECRSLYDGLVTFRRKIERKRLENLHLWSQINSLMLCKAPDDSRVFFRKKIGEVSGRSLVILNAAARLNSAMLGDKIRIECPAIRPDLIEPD